MFRIREDDLPHRGSSHNFVGADNGGVGVSVFLFNGGPGSGPARRSSQPDVHPRKPRLIPA